MKKLILPVIILLLTLSAVTISSKSNVTKDSENIVMIGHEEFFRKLEYGKVFFKHQKHVEAMAKIKGLKEEGVCTECHREQLGELSFSFVEIRSLKTSDEIKNAYHGKCLICHQELSSKKINTGPEILSCRDCHRKENQRDTIKHPIYEFDFAIHDKHVNKLTKDCSLCHHTYDLEEQNKELALVYEPGSEQSCSYCHDLSKKKGPELSKFVEINKRSGLNLQRASHHLCLNCHVKNKSEGKSKSPIRCNECHNGKYRTLEELRDTPRPDVGQPKRVFILSEEGKMKGVPFKHDFHEGKTRSCRSCHHETLKPCNSCHDMKGKEEGGFVNLLTAYHSLSSKLSCQGCHRGVVEDKKECMGCHYLIAPVKAEIGKIDTCQRCHTGKKAEEEFSTMFEETKSKLSLPQIKEEVVIRHIEREFEPVKMPHGRIVRKLNELISKNRISTYFHGNINTLCRGCHHKSNLASELSSEKPPLCINCHSVSFSSNEKVRPRLEAAYHGMCIRCHEILKLSSPKKCTDCHERKVKRDVHN